MVARKSTLAGKLIALTLGVVGASGLVGLYLSLRPARENVRFQQLSSSFFDPPAHGPPLVTVFPQPFAPALHRRGLTLEELLQLQPNDHEHIPDPSSVSVYKPYLDRVRRWEEHPEGEFHKRTNGLGLRDDDDPNLERPALRTLILGDSHVDGVLPNEAHFGQDLERRLRVHSGASNAEVINAGHGGQSLFHYLGALERLSWLRPNACIVVVYGGNDFDDLLTLHHRFAGTVRPPGMGEYGKLFNKAKSISQPALAQCFTAIKYFSYKPDQIDIAIGAALAVSSEIDAQCERLGADAMFVYLPPLLDAQAERYELDVERLREVLELRPEDLTIHERMADRYLAGLRTMGVETLDLRPAFRAATVGLYWKRDHHINLEAQRVIADQLRPWLERTLLDGRRPHPVVSQPLLANGGPSRELLLDLCERIAADSAPDVVSKPRARPPERRARSSHAAHEVHAAESEPAGPPRAVLIGDLRFAQEAGGDELFDRVVSEWRALGVDEGELRFAGSADASLDTTRSSLDAVLAQGPQWVVVLFDEETDWAEWLGTDEPSALSVAQRIKSKGALEDAVDSATDALLDVHERCESARAKLMFVRIPSPLSVGASGWMTRLRVELDTRRLERADVASLDAASRSLLTRLRSAGVRTLDAQPLLQMAPRGGFESSGRLTSYGRELVAALLARGISRPIQPPPQSLQTGESR